MAIRISGSKLQGVTLSSVTTPEPTAMELVADSSKTIDTILLPLTTLNGPFSVDVDWGDGNTGSFTVEPVQHTYATSGIYTVKITGSIDTFGNHSSADLRYLTGVSSFGDLGITSLRQAFGGATNLTSVPTTLPSTITNLSSVFFGCTSFNQDINAWVTSNVTDMSYMFNAATAFDQLLDSWDTDNVTDMSGMFGDATAFNQPLNSWNTSNVTNMGSMFYNATAFNQPLYSWVTSNVIDMSGMFSDATAFNQPLNSWVTSNVTDMSYMFWNAAEFNRDISSWVVTNIPEAPEGFADGSSIVNPAYLPHWGV